MACATCGHKSTLKGYVQQNVLTYPPLNSTDVEVYDGTITRMLENADWNNGRHKLLLFYPETFTPVCQSELGALNSWVDSFSELGCDVYSITTDPILQVRDWYESEESLMNPKYKALSSYLLPYRLGIMNGDRVKRSSVFIMNDGDVVKQEHFMKVGRNISELHRMLYGYSTGNYCSEGWNNPEDGFLEK